VEIPLARFLTIDKWLRKFRRYEKYNGPAALILAALMKTPRWKGFCSPLCSNWMGPCQNLLHEDMRIRRGLVFLGLSKDVQCRNIM
jgi:hypothetical protein